jgi:hypothetical protein
VDDFVNQKITHSFKIILGLDFDTIASSAEIIGRLGKALQKIERKNRIN